MPTDFTRYQPPGVYVESVMDGVVTTSSAPQTIVTIVGPSRGYQVITQAMTLTNTDQPLSKRGVLPNSHPSPDLTVRKVDGTVLVAGTDYDVTFGDEPDEQTVIKRHTNASGVAAGDSIFVSYAYADASFFLPKTFDDFSTIENFYGPSFVSEIPADGSSQVASPLSLAARLAFENGAATVICLATQPVDGQNTLRARFAQAYAKLANDPTVTMIVPLFVSSDGNASAYTSGVQGLINDVKVHCVNQSNDGFGRIAIFGLDTVYDSSATDFDDVAVATASRRAVMAFPHRMGIFNNNLSVTTEVGGPYLAAAYAGSFAADNVSRGLTQVQVNGFNGIPADLRAQMTTAYKNTLSAAGVAVTELGRNNSLVVRHGVSTDTTDLVTTEVSITRSGDTLYRLVSDGLQGAGLIGDPIDSEMTIRIKGIVQGILDGAMADRVIRGYPVLQVRQQSLPGGNPTAVEVQFGWQPFLPLNYILVTFSLDLTNGEATIATDAA